MLGEFWTRTDRCSVLVKLAKFLSRDSTSPLACCTYCTRACTEFDLARPRDPKTGSSEHKQEVFTAIAIAMKAAKSWLYLTSCQSNDSREGGEEIAGFQDAGSRLQEVTDFFKLPDSYFCYILSQHTKTLG